MIEDQKEEESVMAFLESTEEELIIVLLERIVQKSTVWHYHKATLSANASEKIELVVSKK